MTSSLIRKIFLPLFVVCIGLVAAACNDEDDIDIFVGRTWKVSNLFGATNRPVLSEEQAKTIAKDGSFYIKFDSRTEFKGCTLDKNFSGTWSVDLKKRTISLRFRDTGNPSDQLSKMVIKAIQNAVAYDGDYNYLKLRDAEAAYILFRPY